jgi:hypothetical protein
MRRYLIGRPSSVWCDCLGFSPIRRILLTEMVKPFFIQPAILQRVLYPETESNV